LTGKNGFCSQFQAIGPLANDYELTIKNFSYKAKKLAVFTIILDRREWFRETNILKLLSL
jgi:hypothetical protein